MTKRHTECPLFLSQSLQEGLAEKLPQIVVEEEEPEVVAEQPSKVTDEPFRVKEWPAEEAVEAAVEEEEREVAVEAPWKARDEPLPIQEWPVEERAEAVVEEESEAVVGPTVKETMEPLPVEGLSADVLPEVLSRREKRKIAVESPLRVAQKMGQVAMSAVLKNLPGIAGGGVFLILLCVGGLIVFRTLRRALEPGFPSSGALPSLVPGALLLVSVISLLGAVLLIGLFLWTRRATTR